MIKAIVRVYQPSTFLKSTCVVYMRQLLKFSQMSVYSYDVHLDNSRCLYDTTLKVEAISMYTNLLRLVSWPFWYKRTQKK